MTQLLDILGPVTLITLIGYAMGRSSLGLDTRTLSTIVILVATPALIFNTLASLDVQAGTLGWMTVAALGCLGAAGALGFVVLRIASAPVRSYLPPLMMPNSGNMGLPLVVLTFGESGLPLAISYFVVVALAQHSVGLSIAAGTVRGRDLVRQPLIWAVLLSLVVMIGDVPVPQVILTTTRMMGGMMIPAMLILLGASLATLTVSDLRPAVAVAFGRLGIGVVAATVTIWALGLDGITAGAVFLLATMPAAIVTHVYAERFDQGARQVAGAVVASTVLTFACLPVLVWIALWLADQPMSGL